MADTGFRQTRHLKEDNTSKREAKLDWQLALSVCPFSRCRLFRFSGGFPRFFWNGDERRARRRQIEDYRKQERCAFFRFSTERGARWVLRNKRAALRLGPV